MPNRRIWSRMNAYKRYWLVPIVVMTLLFGALVALSQGTTVSPFLYSLF